MAWISSAATAVGRAVLDALPVVSSALTIASPFLCLAAGVTALLVPKPFTEAITPQVVEGCLAATAAAMALTLTPARVWAAATRPWLLALSIILEFGVAPVVAFALGHIFRLSSGLRAGLTLLGCTNGGQASNLTTYIARGDVGLSVLMTLASSLLATVAIPGLSRLYLSGVVSVDAAGLAASTAKLVLAPLAAGVAVKAVAARAVDAIEPLLPVVGIAAVVTVVLGSTALAAERIKSTWSEALAPALLLFIVLFLLGYGVGRWACRQGRPIATALAFEAGFKNPPLAFVLARRHFSDPAVQTASAVTILVLAPLFMGAAVGFRLFVNPVADTAEETPNDKVLPPVGDLPAIPPLQSPSTPPSDGDFPDAAPEWEAPACPPSIATPNAMIRVGHSGKPAP
ncbi:hypothetical protein MMPV_007422 [Pyropia vietnamensis]